MSESTTAVEYNEVPLADSQRDEVKQLLQEFKVNHDASAATDIKKLQDSEHAIQTSMSAAKNTPSKPVAQTSSHTSQSIPQRKKGFLTLDNWIYVGGLAWFVVLIIGFIGVFNEPTFEWI